MFSPGSEIFPGLRLPDLSNVPTSFYMKVQVFKYKTACEESYTFGESL